MTVRPYSVLVALLAMGLFATVGYRIGWSERATAADAASTWGNAAAATFSHARSAAYHDAWQRAYSRGRRDGALAAQRAASDAGAAAGGTQAATDAAASRALASALASAPIRLPGRMKTDRCVPIAGGLCEVLGPRVTGKRCPPGSVPNVRGGIVCVPRVLLRVARMDAASAPLQLTP